MGDFKWRHFKSEFILWAVRWYCKYGVNYRELAEMLEERGVKVDHTTIYRWVQTYAPKIEKRLRWYWKKGFGGSWQVDETYIRIKGEWKYLYRAIDSTGNTIDFYLSHTRNAKDAKRFLAKAIKAQEKKGLPRKINTDKAGCYTKAISELKDEGRLPEDIEHRQVKYMNNKVEADHGKLKRLIKPTLGFQSMKTAFATIKGFEIMRMFKKGQLDIWKYDQGVLGEVRLINRQFDIYSI